ncbi:MAG: amino acid adenylation domain protein [Clostridiaceae bacterium]|nr:amino acid adenylation domain protein [Clostridiaceae bacterium]
MIPSYFVKIDRIPLTVNGKIDKNALPEPDIAMSDLNNYEAPRNSREVRLVQLFKEVLEVGSFGINDNFFELGGHSLSATVLLSNIEREFNVRISLSEFFKDSRIINLSDLIINESKDEVIKIRHVEDREVYPVSFAQERLFIVNNMDEVGISYNIPAIMVLDGELNRNNFERSIKDLVQRHESLRSSFEFYEEELVQRIHNDIKIRTDYREVAEDNLISEIESFIKPFDLGQVPLFRVGIFKVNPYKHIFVMDMHHIISDGISMKILMDDLSKLYEGKELAKLRLQYRDFAVWQHEIMESDELKKQGAFWRKRFSGEIPVLDLPTDFDRETAHSFVGGTVSVQVDSKLSEALNNVAKANSCTLYMIMLANLNVLLSRYARNDDIIIGSPATLRNNYDLNNVVGMFVNMLVMRNNVDSSLTFTEFLKNVRNNTLDAFDNKDYQFEDLIDDLKIRRDGRKNPLFDVTFDMQRKDFSEIHPILGELKISPYNIEHNVSKFDISVLAEENDFGIKITFEYCKALYKQETIEDMLRYFINIIEQVVANPNIELGDIELLTYKEKKHIINDFNNTEILYPKDKTINALFEDQAEKYPNNIALIYKGDQITYRQLNERANKFARVLRNKGVKSNVIVGLMINRSLDMIAIMLGILKAGGAYLPIDPEYPLGRVRDIIEDSKTPIFIIEDILKERFSDIIDDINKSNCTTVSYVDELRSDAEDECYDNFQGINVSSDLAYVMYTSGSTGKPKGNLTNHYNIVRVVRNTNYIDIKTSDRILQLSNYAFDGSTFDIYGALLNGASLVLIDKEKILDLIKLSDIIINEKISIFFVTTALFNTLVDLKPEIFKDIRKILFGGERVSPGHVKKAFDYMGKDKIIHVYGPTESTVFASYYCINHLDGTEKNIPIGRPIANTYMYVLDKNYKLQPIGVPGELCIGGDGLVKGYLNREELTQDKIVDNPFKEHEKIYKTGDLVKLTADGNIYFIGRIDDQIKLRGFRIELGEIEENIRKIDNINECVVVVKEGDSGDRFLAAYYTANKKISNQQFQEMLCDRLPNYMIPKAYVKLDSMPLTLNGKVDRKSLPSPTIEVSNSDSYNKKPSTETEKVLLELWCSLLKSSQIGIYNNFFDLGGNSLLLIKMHSSIEKIFPGIVGVADIFDNPSIARLAMFIDRNNRNYSKEISTGKLTLPDEYFNYDNSEHEERNLSFIVKGDIFNDLKKKSDQLEVNIENLLVSLYAYLLYEVTEFEQVSMNLVLRDKNHICPITLEVNEVDEIRDFYSIFKKMNDKINHCLDKESYKFEEVSSNKNFYKDNHDIALLITNDEDITEYHTKGFDLLIKMMVLEDRISFQWKFDDSKLKIKKIEKLAYNYFKLMKMITNN